MNEQEIGLKSVNELRMTSNQSFHFFIPDYQRGYRWSPLQVKQLLDDIYEFARRDNPQTEEFYCLQPLVIKVRPNGSYEVVDGQQRLTTLLLILRHFNERLAVKYRQPLFTLQYATRPSLDSFLTSPSEDAANENVDFFHLYQAIQTIEAWFDQRDSEVEDIKSTLLNRTKVIWFQLASSDNAVNAFTRLNVGKIPLTNDELIRALFLRGTTSEKNGDMNVQLRIAYEWDQLEKALQSDAFWYFLSNQPRQGQNRIDFLFDLVARSEGGISPETANDDYGLFYFFNQRLKTPGSKPEKEWRKIKQTYQMLEEWYEDRVLYHMVGFLVSQGVSINEIRKLSLNCTKSAFVQRLRSEIFRLVIDKELPNPPDDVAVREEVADRLKDLTYGSKRHNVKALLLLFNLATLLQNQKSNMRFQFDSFKSERWDIEHIRSVGDDKPVRHHDRRDWLKNCLGYLQTQKAENELRREIEAFLEVSQGEATNEIFDPLYEQVLDYFGETTDGEEPHGIANLTLLDEHTNRSYKNAVFAVKRQYLLNLDQAGIFVPLCTRNVFLKCYSPQVDNVMFWSEADQEGYENAITNVLVNFFCGEMEGNQ
ncbi:MAG: DUF262 domain-containing protein [Anaerolineales bacterium]|nr:DUF262 domain-containing protein [Anaerolineales bacterium]